jgi:hypothetical protein
MRNKAFIKRNICYLCSKPGADTKDHVPPKGLFQTTQQRLTLPAHKKCNNEFAGDEEYFRDVVMQQAVAFNMRNVEGTVEKIWRSWSKTGSARYKELIKTAQPVLVETKSGLVQKRISIKPNREVLKKIAIKIAKGVVYNDTGVITRQEDYNTVYFPVTEVLEIKKKDKDEFFWKAMSSEFCLHTYYGPNFGARRAYILSEKRGDSYTVTSMLGLILGSAFYMTIVVIRYDEIKNKNLQILTLPD